MSAPEIMNVDELARELERKRAIDAARKADELARIRAEAEHARAQADVYEAVRLAELARAEREAEARARAEQTRLLRQTRAAGERARVAAAVARSGEARALRLERTRALSLRVLVPLLVGFGVWSTAGVQQGGARLMGATSAEPTWWALWALEPVLIGVVVWVIVARARLATSGGRMARGAERVAGAALATSIALNLVAALPTSAPVGAGAVVALLGSMLAHAIGPVGAAATAYLIGVVDASVSAADPWADSGAPAPLLAELTATASENAPESTPVSAAERASGVRTETGASAPGSAHAGARNRDAVTPRRHEATASAGRAATDDELMQRWRTLVDAGELPADASTRQLQKALGVGFPRVRRLRENADPMPGQTAIDHPTADDEDRRLHAVTRTESEEAA